MPGGALLGPLGLAGILVVASRAVGADPFARSAVAAVASVALIVGVEAHDRAPLARVLALRPVAYLGTISYATYLWHWPIIVLLGHVETLDLGTRGRFLLTAAVATGLAALSSELLELPVRRPSRLDRHRHAVIAGGLALSVTAAVVALPPLLDPDRPSAIDQRPEIGQGAFETPVPATFDFLEVYEEEFGVRPDCTDGPATDCTVVDGDGAHLLLVGDSQAVMYIPALTELARATDLRLSVAALEGCPWQLGYTHLAEEIQRRCAEARPDTYERLVPELDPDVIVLVNSQLDAGGGPAPSNAEARRLREATAESIERLAASGAEVVVVDPAPRIAGFNPLACLDDAAFVEECSFEALDVRSWVADDLRGVADRIDAVHYVDWDRIVCPSLPTCDAVVDGVVAFWDGTHITARWSRAIAPAIGDSLVDLGVLAQRMAPGE